MTIDRFTGEYRFLSNFYEGPFPVMWEGFACRTAEHAYQCAKAAQPGVREMIALAATPGQAKRAGRNIELRSDWEEIKLDVMRRVLAVKFESGTDLADRLLATGDRLLVEGNTWNDRFWGVCKEQGRNWLGHLLMARRAELRATEALARSVADAAEDTLAVLRGGLTHEQGEQIAEILVRELDDPNTADAGALLALAEVVGLEIVYEEQTYRDGSVRNEPVAIRRPAEADQGEEVTGMAWFNFKARETVRRANFGARPAPTVTPAQRVKNSRAARKRNQDRKAKRGK